MFTALHTNPHDGPDILLGRTRLRTNDIDVIWPYHEPMVLPRYPVSARTVTESSGLSARDGDILAFERQWWKFAGAKEQAIRDKFQMSATRYYQVLNALIDKPEALAHDPLLVKRLRRLRATRQRFRSAKRLGIDLTIDRCSRQLRACRRRAYGLARAYRLVPVAADRQTGLALEEVAGRPIAGAQHRPAHADRVHGVERQSEAVARYCQVCCSSCSNSRGLAASSSSQVLTGGDHAADRERTGDRELEPVALAEEQAARSAADLGPADHGDAEAERSGQVDEVADEAQPLPAGRRPPGLHRARSWLYSISAHAGKSPRLRPWYVLPVGSAAGYLSIRTSLPRMRTDKMCSIGGPRPRLSHVHPEGTRDRPVDSPATD